MTSPSSSAPDSSSGPRRPRWVTWSGGLGLLLGVLLWATTGAPSVPPYAAFGTGTYLGAAVMAGGLTALVPSERPWLGALGVWIGQGLYIAFVYVPALSTDPMILPPFILVLVLGALPPLGGTAGIVVGRQLFGRTTL